jgi:hypothetical protein
MHHHIEFACAVLNGQSRFKCYNFTPMIAVWKADDATHHNALVEHQPCSSCYINRANTDTTNAVSHAHGSLFGYVNRCVLRPEHGMIEPFGNFLHRKGAQDLRRDIR